MAKDSKWRRNIAENFNRLSTVYERYRRQTDGRQHITFTFANKSSAVAEMGDRWPQQTWAKNWGGCAPSLGESWVPI